MVEFVGNIDDDQSNHICEYYKYNNTIDNTVIDYEPIIKKYRFGNDQIAYTTLIYQEKINESFIDYFSNIFPEIFEKEKSRKKFFNAISDKSASKQFVDKYIDDLNFNAVLKCLDADDDYIIQKKWLLEKNPSYIGILFDDRHNYHLSEKIIKGFSELIVSFYRNHHIYSMFRNHKFSFDFLKELVQSYHWKDMILTLIDDLEDGGNIHSMFINRYSSNEITIMRGKLKDLCELDG